MLLCLPLTGWSAPRVAVSIAPLHGLVSDIMAGVAQPDLIYEGSQSPHSSALSPYQLKILVETDLLIWVGPELETSLARLTQRLSPEAVNLRLHDYDAGMTLHESRESLFEEGGEDAGNHGHDHGDLDPHFWLSMANARVFVRAMTDRLVELDESNADRYRANAEALLAELQALDRQLTDRLAPLTDKPFIVFHDGFQYFERDHRLNALGALVLQPDVPPGPRTVARLVELAKPHDGLCLLHEPQYSDRWLQSMTRSLPNARIAQIDPLGFEQTPGAGHYQALMTQLATDLARCLEQLP
ncbi:zinc ABC transporter substrate-binding protein [Saccharospirillum salsuginis]|uniref:High-affinity zinc uptake system protein ZnuA n=1 Tax=Saccharospirillum salsuginis TaxID=418750 RepID=A0A918NDB7_9GAMM|nr:zinc ABC transporter substrate-binding protein [Saccharospirillum salsuginis]